MESLRFRLKIDGGFRGLGFNWLGVEGVEHEEGGKFPV